MSTLFFVFFNFFFPVAQITIYSVSERSDLLYKVVALPQLLFLRTQFQKFFQIINSIFSFRGVRGCSGSYCCEKIQQIQGFSICRAVNRLLWLAVPARSGVNGFILGRVDFLLIFPPHQHQRQQVHPRRGIYTPLKVPRE